MANPWDDLPDAQINTKKQPWDDLPDAGFENSSKNIPIVKSSAEKQTSNPLAAFGIGAMQGASFGLGDEAQGVVGGLERAGKYFMGNTKGDKGVFDALRTGYISDRDAARAQEQALVQSNPISSFAGQIASGIPSLAAKGALTIPSMIAQGALSGYGNAQGNLQDQAIGTGTGAAIGGALGAGVNLLGKGASAVNKSIQKQALKTPARLAEKVAGREPQLIKQGVEAGAFDVFSTQQGRLDKIKNYLQNLEQKQQAIRQTLPSAPLSQVETAINAQGAKLNRLDTLDAPKLKQLDDILNNIKVKGKEVLSAADIVSEKSRLGEAARTAFGDVSKNKQGLEMGRKALRNVENDLAKEVPQYIQNRSKEELTFLLKDIAQRNVKSESSPLNNVRGITPALQKYLLEPTLNAIPRALVKLPETSIGKTAAYISEKLKIDPKVVAYLLSRQNAGEE